MLYYRAASHLFKNEFDVKAKFLSMDEQETLSFIEDMLEFCLHPKVIDCSKSVIFVIGNLDEAYTMSNNYNPDLSADEFHELSKKIYAKGSGVNKLQDLVTHISFTLPLAAKISDRLSASNFPGLIKKFWIL